MNNNTSIRFVFFGTPNIAVWVLEELEKDGYLPVLVVTNPDRPTGRHQELTPTPVKVWAEARNIPTLEPGTLKDDTVYTVLQEANADLFIVAAYGKIIPERVLQIPPHKTLNMHPSLLPHFRGASPIRSAILRDAKETGVTIIQLDNELDHGPIAAQKIIQTPVWPPRGNELDELLAREGAQLLVHTLPDWVEGKMSPTPQQHGSATFCEKITKEMGEINLDDDPYQNLLKIRAFDGWPGTFFFVEKNGKRIRVKIEDAELAPNGSLKILRVVPEGKREMVYSDFNPEV